MRSLSLDALWASFYGKRPLWLWWLNTSNCANKVDRYFGKTPPHWLLNSPGRSKRKGAEDSQNGGFCVMWTIIWQQGHFRRSKKKIYCQNHRIYKGHFPLIENHFQQGSAGYEVDDEGTFSLKYLPSRFDEIGVPQMNIGILEDHAFLIRNLEKGTNHYCCNDCQQTFTKIVNLRRHAAIC